MRNGSAESQASRAVSQDGEGHPYKNMMSGVMGAYRVKQDISSIVAVGTGFKARGSLDPVKGGGA